MAITLPRESPPGWRSCSDSFSVPARRSGWRWAGPSLTGFPSRCSSWSCTSSWANATASAARRSAPRWSRRRDPVAIISPPRRSRDRLVAFIIALTKAKTYWLMYGLYTFSIVLLLSAPGKVGFEAEERGVDPGRCRPARRRPGRRPRSRRTRSEARPTARTRARLIAGIRSAVHRGASSGAR